MRKMIGIGLSLTGTGSLAEAPGRLGYRAVHYPTDPTTRREIVDFHASGDHALRLSAPDAAAALVDLPAPWVYPALARAYPGSRCALTVREQASWLASCARHWERRSIAQAVEPPAASDWAFVDFLRQQTYGISHVDPAVFAAVYDRHHAHARAYFANRPADCLILDSTAGAAGHRCAGSWMCPFPTDHSPGSTAPGEPGLHHR